MRGRNEGLQSRRIFISVVAAVFLLSILSLYYGSFFNSRARQSPQVEDQFDNRVWPGLKDNVANDGQRGVDRIVELAMREDSSVEEDQDSTDKLKEIGGNDEDPDLKLHAEERLESGAFRGNGGMGELTLKTFPVCDSNFTEIIPCLDRRLHAELKLKLNLAVMEHYERHCPPPQRRINCLVPPPPNYKVPIKWPRSLDEVWRANVPHTFLASKKSDQHWMVVQTDKIRFPGGGTHFPDGADKYIAALGKMLKSKTGDLSKGGKIRTALDLGCGVASFGAYLLPDILAMSLAPNDVHENQIQFALERGIPSTLGVLGTMRLPFPSRSFDFAHCSRCRIDWHQRDGILLLEVDRLLRPGGYFAWSSPPVYREDEENRNIWNKMSKLVTSMCWTEVAKEGQTVIWMKNSTKECYDQRGEGAVPPLCSTKVHPDSAWQVPMEACITPVNNVGIGRRTLLPWPKRLTSPSPRLKSLASSNKVFLADSNAWVERVALYWSYLESSRHHANIRNVLDMKAHLGGFAAALSDKPVWVMNVVPATGPNTLTIIYDRGLIGSLHDWCESFSSYPRTYDLLHAWSVFSEIEDQGCSLEDLLLEMDRLLRPHGFVIIRDKSSLVNQVRRYLKALRWDMWSTDIEPSDDDISNAEEKEKILLAQKSLWEPEDETVSDISEHTVAF